MHLELDNFREKEYMVRFLAQSRLKVAFTGTGLPICLEIPDFLRSLSVGIWGRKDLFVCYH